MSIIYTEYSGQPTITITCNNYNNPVYSKVVTGFEIRVVDAEQPPNLVADYPPWSLDASTLVARTLTTDLGFKFFLNNEDTPTKPVPIQTESGIEIGFDMGTIPIESSGCWLKVTFPDDFVNTANVMTYQGYDMMLTSRGTDNLNVNSEVFIKNQAQASGNFIIFQGCTNSAYMGAGRSPKVKITGVVTPNSQKETAAFTVEIFKTYSQTQNALSNLIFQGTGVVSIDYFTSG